MDLDLAGRRAMVTGSSGGIGAAVAERLVDEGCAVLVHGRDPARVGEVAARLRAVGGVVGVALGDLADEDAAGAVAEQALEWGVEILVNNAGPFSEHDWETAEPAMWLDAVNGNVVSAVRLIRALVPGMRERGWGRVVNVGSRAATTPLPNMVEYSAAKAAVVNMTTSLAQHLAGSGITANTVSPGVIVTDGMRQMFEDGAAARGWPGQWPELEPLVVAEYAPNPTGRLGTAADIAAAVAFLVSPLAGYINGINLRVDGGIASVP
ncbi:short-chain dehydrogenase [Streptomyces violaceusniger]|uniref:SDR family NAD(P)-dependent oxidoreductase n=3 Tax=Streptomyces TaxID=1883 RepID=A0ABD5JM04_9ACTN|nr:MULTISPECIES: SDR family NAD(P)-dependent oxidoreductase [Streptomyces]MEE4589477.1 SDR family NAD(P)-dependent oxidoreductase [Streptomyces sp. DSM 41602]WTA86626.1 SDR family oxidoreductase [Streptomyces antimycoticus]KUL48422.1 short-chain dehydrogenase [Streptomyces violaceusniger]RSS49209.1 SDR family oxidoreductase [Streptomyces sp. WAC05858]WTB11087.1 SDR family oxidoreductase [Streptomyces antimycoticus]